MYLRANVRVGGRRKYYRLALISVHETQGFIRRKTLNTLYSIYHAYKNSRSLSVEVLTVLEYLVE